MKIFSLFDRKSREYGDLVLFPTTEFAMRVLLEMVPQAKGAIKSYPEDFDVYWLGEFNPLTGEILVEKIPAMVFNVGELFPHEEV